MKVFFNKIDNLPFSELVVYSSLNRIPFTLRLSNAKILPDTIYTRNLSEKNFIEFRFDKNTKQLYEITLVSVQNSTTKSLEYNVDSKDIFFSCYIDENSELDVSVPIQVSRSSKSLDFIWSDKKLKTYPIAQNCVLGIDDSNHLCSILLINLNEKIISEILGY